MQSKDDYLAPANPLSSKGEAVSESAGGEITRYAFTNDDGHGYKLTPDPMGAAVKYRDHESELSRLREREAVLVEALEKARGWMGVYLDVPCYRQMLADDKEFVKAALEAKP